MGGPKWDRGEVLNENPVLGGNSWIWGVDNTSGGDRGGLVPQFPRAVPHSSPLWPFSS